MGKNPDVFLAHHSSDKPAVREIAKQLISKEVQVWLDERELIPGEPWRPRIEEALAKCKSIAVFVGPNGIGDWQELEIDTALAKAVRDKRRVIPILLPGTEGENDLPSFLHRNTWVDFRKGLDNGENFERLYWGITGKRLDPSIPQNQRLSAQSETRPQKKFGDDDAVQDAFEQLSFVYNSSGSVTFFLGPRSFSGSANPPLTASEIVHSLLLELGPIDKSYKELLPTLDIAGNYYAVKAGSQGLEQRVVGMIKDRKIDTPILHKRLAELIKLILTRPPSRSYIDMPILIVTTNLDVLMERALFNAGVPFTRIVQFRSAQNIRMNEYQNIETLQDGKIRISSQSARGEVKHEVDPENIGDLEATIAKHGIQPLSSASSERSSTMAGLQNSRLFDENTKLILYKYHGSQDIRKSCAISVDQFYELARYNQVAPSQITEIISQTPSLFLGYGLLDPCFRNLYHTLLRNSFELDGQGEIRYAIQSAPADEADPICRRMESKIWEKIKHAWMDQTGIHILEIPPQDFIDRFYDRIREQFNDTSTHFARRI
jgi:hypothetical protein